ncbi:sodium-dependent dicarboxylate transporter 2/3/5 [Planifilum fimeticola]|uniref:Sodium-dependent dicarboxylate transporter SdcS n=2 Tax=Planifilum fimeticola TaxID=201975 RepID=A0A2T0LIM7_9BACL|nr:sodium-dependent dicarboxylate transporter 2/3/5 [Planifilum fimeticola]
MYGMVRTTWSHLWKWHHQAIDLLRFSVGMDARNEKKEGGEGEASRSNGSPPFYTRRQQVGLILGPLLFIVTLFILSPQGMSYEAQAVLASTLWIATWWITEAIPIPATSLLPIVLFPLTGALASGDTTAAYGDPTIFLFMGGFMLALAMERWNLHKRIALNIISLVGTSTERIILGTMVATGFLSMWISNSATAMMMMPIGLAIIYQIAESLKEDPSVDTSPGKFNFGKSLMLGIAYSASIGGIGTLIGTPPNAILAATVRKMFGVEISFAQWMLFAVPMVVLLLALTWFYLVKVAFPMNLKNIPGGREVIQAEKQALGPLTGEERWVGIVFFLAAVAWIFRVPLEKVIPGINDTLIAIGAALVLFVIPSTNKPGERILNWETAKNLPWGILLLFGGGLAIAEGFTSTGLDQWIGKQLTLLEGVGFALTLVLTITLVIFLTEITSNTATATMMYPIMASFAAALSVHPYGLMIAAGVAASCAYMLPVATPPNAVVFGSGYIRIEDMARAGFWLNLISIAVIFVAIYFYLPPVWGIDLLSPLK